MKPIQHSQISKSAVSCQLSVVSCSRTRGFLLLELLIAISILAIILSVGSESVYVSMQSGKISSDVDTATGLANETLEAVRAISDERWQSIYDLTKGSQYHTVQSGTKWATSTASEIVALNTASYTRDFVVQNVCRDTTVGSRLIVGLTDSNGADTTCTPISNLFDPSTQKVTVTVSWAGSGSPIVISDYFSRWRNVACTQSSWTTSGSGDVERPCGTSYYDSASSTLTFTGGIQVQ